MLNYYRKVINPPYTRGDLPIILLTILLLLILPLIILLSVFNSNDPRTRAEKPESNKNFTIGSAVSSEFSSLVQVSLPAPGSQVTLPLTVQATIDPSIKPTQVEFSKDNDKSPFAILYSPLDDTQGNVYETLLSSLRPGRHTLRVSAMLPDGNILMSEEISFDVR